MATRTLARFGLRAVHSRITRINEGGNGGMLALQRRHDSSSSSQTTAPSGRDVDEGRSGKAERGGRDGTGEAAGEWQKNIDGGGGGDGGEFKSALQKGSAAAEARVNRDVQMQRAAPLEFASSKAGVAGSAPAVIVQDTLEMMRGLEREGFSPSQAEKIVRTILATVKDSVEPLCTRADLDRHVLLQQADLRQFQHDLTSRHREATAASKHSSDMVTSEIEKLRAEVRYTHEKVMSSQKLDMNLERGRIRDDLQAQDNKTAAMEIRLDREIQAMRTTIEAAKNDVIKYSIGAVMSMAAVGMSLIRLLS